METLGTRERCWKCLGSLIKKEVGPETSISLSRLEILSTGEISFPGTVDPPATHTGILVEYRGDDTIKLFSFMDKLRDKALAAGGMVLSHLGNHEWMNVIGASFEISQSPHGLTKSPSSGDWRCISLSPQSVCAVTDTHLDTCTHRKSRRSAPSQRGQR